MEKWIGFRFESSTGLTPEFAQFAKEIKKYIKNILAPIGAELISFNRGHFYVSGFIKKDSKYVYFSISDVRGTEWGYD